MFDNIHVYKACSQTKLYEDMICCNWSEQCVSCPEPLPQPHRTPLGLSDTQTSTHEIITLLLLNEQIPFSHILKADGKPSSKNGGYYKSNKGPVFNVPDSGMG